jgi:hypothetical protein
LQRPAIDTASLEQTVNEVLLEVQKNGDSAIKKFTLKFDKVQINQLLVNEGEFEEAEKTCSPELKAAIQLAKNNIETRPIISGNFLNQPSVKLYNLNHKNIKFPKSQEIEDRGFL